MSQEQIKSILSEIIIRFLRMDIDIDEVQEQLIDELDPEEIYEIEDDMEITDCYFALKYLKETGFETSTVELEYFSECFSGKRVYNVNEKNELLMKN